jgi:PPOX class probable F420-dependent enzyme
LPDRLFGRLLHPQARVLALGAGRPAAEVGLGGSRYLLLVSFRRDGSAVATPLWFAELAGVLYARSERMSGKAKRIRREGRVLIAPSNWRGRPRDAVAQAYARILGPGDTAVAERALAARYGLMRRVYSSRVPTRDPVYISR